MIPIRDDNPIHTTPFVTVGLIVINVIVFVYQMTMDPAVHERFIYAFGAIPMWLKRDWALLPQFPEHWPTLISSMFLHGSVMHVAGNMLYLWIFGNNIEDHLGHFRFLVFYLLAGLAAALTHTLTDVSSPIPMIGASGAISGILGAYMMLYPRARVTVLIWFFFVRFISIPAFLMLGLWFLMQLPGALGDSNGIAWFAHIGGFVFGVLIIHIFKRRRRLSRPYLV